MSKTKSKVDRQQAGADNEHTVCKMNALAEKDTVKKHGLNVWVDSGEDGAEPKVE